MLDWWMFFDENKYNVETLKNVFEYSVPISSMSDQVTFSLLGEVLVYLFKQYPVHLYALIFAAMLGFAAPDVRAALVRLSELAEPDAETAPLVERAKAFLK